MDGSVLGNMEAPPLRIAGCDRHVCTPSSGLRDMIVLESAARKTD